MAIYANASNQVAALKELYTGDDYMKDLVYKKNPLLALLPKDESPSGFAGKYIPVPLIFGTPQGRSATFVNAQNNQTAPQLASFFVYRVSNYQLATITNELLEATKDNAGAFIDEAKLVMDTAFRNISNDLASDLYRSGTGSRGQIGAITLSGANTSVSITLASRTEVNQFEVGMVLVACATDGGAPSSDTVTISGVNRNTGVLTAVSSVNPSNTLSANWAINSFLVVQGDIPTGGASSTGSFLKVSGLAAWGPKVAPGGSDSFWNVNRSQDSRMYFVIAQGTSSETIEEALIDSASQVAEIGGMPDMCFMNFTSYAALEKSLGSKVQYVDVKHEEADIAFAGIRIHAPYGPITIIPDRNCPAKTAYLLQMDTLKFRSLGKAPHILTYGMEGLEGLRVGNADALEIRIGYYGNLICSAPCWNAVVSLSQ
jgi:hypothetical protein